MILSITRLRVRSWWYLPSFLLISRACVKQALADPSFRGGSTFVGPGLTYWTATLWADVPSMKAYVLGEPHRTATKRLARWCSEAAITNLEATALPAPAELPGLLAARPKFYTLHHPTEMQRARRVPQDVPRREYPFR